MLTTSVLVLTTFAAAAHVQQEAVPATDRVEGRVVDMRGEPVPAARVWATPWSEPERSLVQTQADGEGCFVLSKVPVCGEAWGIRATAPGRIIGRVWTRPGLEPVTLQLPEAVAVKGRLVGRKGEPVPGVTVRASLALARELGHARDLAVTDAEGRFEIAKVPLGLVWFMAVLPGGGMAAARLHVTAATAIELTPATWKTMNAVIQVRGPEGRVPEGSCVLITSPGVGPPPPWDRIPLDRSGRCELIGMPQWLYTVTPTIPGHVCRPGNSTLQSDRTEIAFDAEAEEVGRQLIGVLRDQHGKALGGVGLQLLAGASARPTTVTTTDGRWRLPLSVAAGTRISIRTLPGDWVLDVVPERPGMAQLLASDTSTFMVPAQPGRELALQAVRGCTVTGRVLLPDGAPAAMVNVSLEEENPPRSPRWMGMASAVTDERGNYRLRGVHAWARPVRVSVEDSRGADTGEPFDLDQAGMHVERQDLKLAAPAIIEGSYVGTDGKPVIGLRIWLLDWDAEKNMQVSGRVIEVFTDSSGRFRFAGVRPGGALLEVGFEGPQPLERAVPAFTVEPGEIRRFDLTFAGK